MNPPADREVLILNAALELPPEQRAAYLDQACVGDPKFRQRIEELLKADAEAEQFLNQPANLSERPTSILPIAEKPGDTIGRYKLLQQIGEGGCGVVYMAEQLEPVRRRVALKVIKLGMDTKHVIARFEAERQALALMDHPNIAKVFDAGSTETGRPYFVMELVRGIKITEFCDENQLPTEARLRLFIQVCQAIQHAHQKGIIHRDIKPSNILVTVNDGVPMPKVIDFGIAKATQDRLTDQTLFTAFEQFIGTPAYMSPEQAAMTSVDIDTRSDIYSLGVLLYELLTSHTPFDANTLLAAGLDEMRRTILEKVPPRPSTRLRAMAAEALTTTAQNRRTDAPKLIHVIRSDLDWIAMKCLAKERARRYETANGLAADIQRHLNHEPVVARPPSKLYEFQKTVRRHRVGFGLTTVIGLLLVAGVVGLSLSNSRIRQEQKEKEHALAAANQNEQEARRQLFISLKRQAEARRYSRQMGQRTESLRAVAAAAQIHKDDELRDIAIAAMTVSDLQFGPSWQLFTTNDSAVAFDANYQRYAVVDKAGVISIRSIPDKRELQRFESQTPALSFTTCCSLEFSPDGRFLAKLEPGFQWTFWRLSDAQILFRTPSEGCSSIAFSKDSKSVAVGVGSQITIFATETGEVLLRWDIPEMPHTMQFSPDDKLLAISPRFANKDTNQTITRIYETTSGKLFRELSTRNTMEQAISWHPSGKYLAATCDLTIQLWDVDATFKMSELQGHAGLVTAVAFNPDGTLVISGSWDDAPRLWTPAPGQELVRCYSGYNFLRFSPDGRWAGVTWNQKGEARLLEALPSTEYQTFLSSRPDAEYSFHLGDVSPDENLLALGSPAGLSLRELPGGRELAWLPIGYLSTAQFAPDGKTLITCGPASGLQVWPLNASDGASKLRFGPPHKISFPFAPIYICFNRDGNALAVASESAGVVAILDLPAGQLREVRFHHPNVCYAALSPDARWLATGGWQSLELKIWDVETGELITSQTGQRCFPTFTPSGDELIVASESGFAFYSTNTWQPSRETIPCASGFTAWPAFSRDEKLMALGVAPGIIQIRDARTSRLLSKLEDPQSHVPLWMAFNQNDTQLLSFVTPAKAIHRWNLQAIRTRLKDLQLDWEWPEFESPSGNVSQSAPLEFEVITRPR